MASRTGNPNQGGSTPFTNPVLVGTSIVVALMVGVFLSYNANKGLPFVQTFPLKAEVPDAQQLVAGSEVRIGGFRVGQVNEIEAVPPKGDQPPYAKLTLALDGTLSGLPEDTLVRVRPRSLLGGKFLELEPGTSEEQIEADGTIRLDQARTTTELDEAFNTFDKDTRDALQGTIRAVGDATAGRGSDINRALVATAELMPPLQRTVEMLAEDKTDLDGFIDGIARTTAALAPAAQELGDLFDNAAITLAAIDAGGDALGRALELLPQTEAVAFDTLGNVNPVLHDLADITVQLRPSASKLPEATNELARGLRSGTRLLKRVPDELAPLANTTLRTLGTVARDDAASGSLRKLKETVEILRPALEYLLPAQQTCNFLPLLVRNLGSTISLGDQSGSWLTFFSLIKEEQIFSTAEPDPELHLNQYPILDDTECEAGNEPYAPGQAIGNPPGKQPAQTTVTEPPEGALERAREAGLLDEIEGARG